MTRVDGFEQGVSNGGDGRAIPSGAGRGAAGLTTARSRVAVTGIRRTSKDLLGQRDRPRAGRSLDAFARQRCRRRRRRRRTGRRHPGQVTAPAAVRPTAATLDRPARRRRGRRAPRDPYGDVVATVVRVVRPLWVRCAADVADDAQSAAVEYHHRHDDQPTLVLDRQEQPVRAGDVTVSVNVDRYRRGAVLRLQQRHARRRVAEHRREFGPLDQICNSRTSAGLTSEPFDMRQMHLTGDRAYFPGDYVGLDPARHDFAAAFTVATNLGLPIDFPQPPGLFVDTNTRPPRRMNQATRLTTTVRRSCAADVILAGSAPGPLP